MGSLLVIIIDGTTAEDPKRFKGQLTDLSPESQNLVSNGLMGLHYDALEDASEKQLYEEVGKFTFENECEETARWDVVNTNDASDVKYILTINIENEKIETKKVENEETNIKTPNDKCDYTAYQKSEFNQIKLNKDNINMHPSYIFW